MESRISSVQRGAALLIRNGARKDRRVDLQTEETLVGRGSNVDLVLPDEGVSREHALLSFDPTTDSWLIEDLQSTNGTRVNGKRVRGATLSNGDEIQIGTVRIDFVID